MSQPPHVEKQLTIEEIDDILDEIEERETKRLLIHEMNAMDGIEMHKKVESLDIELELSNLHQIPDFLANPNYDQKTLMNGYFITYFLEYMQSTPQNIMETIINLCVLFTFQYEIQTRNQSQPQIKIEDDEDDNVSSNNSRTPTPTITFNVTVDKLDDEETSASDLEEAEMYNIILSNNNTPHSSPRPYTMHPRDHEVDAAVGDGNHNKHGLHIAVCQSSIHSKFGQSQSPINIVTACKSPLKSEAMSDIEAIQENPLKFNYPSKISGCTIMNNGHTVQVNIPDDSKCTLFIQNKLYCLKQFHFHTPSEHTIDNKQYEMEMHLVHINDDGEIAVLGFIFTTKGRYKKPKLQLSKSRMHLTLDSTVEDNEDDEESDDMETDDEFEDDKKDDDVLKIGDGKAVTKRGRNVVISNDFLDQFWNELPVNKTSEDIELSTAISFDYLFETSSNNFVKNVETNEINIDMEIFEYMGSLTTPPYTEGVQWLVSKTTHYLNDQQLNKLSACWNHENNAREVQRYFGRKVQLRSQSSLILID